jgi:pyruvate/2-oxoglutarate dehydrogenase complex dihydrolipoamide dehydrogenase (E3) component
MPPAEQFEILVVGSGKGGRLLARDIAQSGRRTAVVERRWIGGACHTVACLPSLNKSLAAN